MKVTGARASTAVDHITHVREQHPRAFPGREQGRPWLFSAAIKGSNLGEELQGFAAAGYIHVLTVIRVQVLNK